MSDDAIRAFTESYSDQQRRARAFGMDHDDDYTSEVLDADGDEDEDDAENNDARPIQCVDCGLHTSVRPPRGHSFVEDDGETDAPTARWHCVVCGAENQLSIRKGQVRTVQPSSASEAFKEAYDEDCSTPTL